MKTRKTIQLGLASVFIFLMSICFITTAPEVTPIGGGQEVRRVKCHAAIDGTTRIGSIGGQGNEPRRVRGWNNGLILRP